jgi:hypothetical protein
MKSSAVSTSSGTLFDVAGKIGQREQLNAQMGAPKFWDNPEKAQGVIAQLKPINGLLKPYEELASAGGDLQALGELAEEGVVQLFRPQDGSAPLVGVVGTLQLDVLQARLGAEYGVAIGFETSPYALARWVSSDDRAALQKFVAENRSAMADDVDGDPVFLATSAFMMRRAAELAPALAFRDIKDVRAEKVAA